jgi:hypothetical protein
MEVLHPRCAGLDIHAAIVVACVRIASGRTVTYDHRTVSTTTRGLLELADWLTAHGVTRVAMEATGVYWKPVWHVLEEHVTLVLANAMHIRNIPGRQSDKNDATWIADLLALGLIRSSFVPPAPIQELRDLIRTRKQLVRERARLLLSANGRASIPASGGRERWPGFGSRLPSQGRSRGTGSGLPHDDAPTGRLRLVEPNSRRGASPQCDRSWHRRHQGTRRPSAPGALHTSGRHADIRHPLRPRTGRADSPPAQFRFGATADVVPRDACRLTRDRPARPSLNLLSPGGFDLGRISGRRLVQTRKELRRDIGPLLHWQGQSLTQKLLRPWRHGAILHPTQAAQHALHQTAARVVSGRW